LTLGPVLVAVLLSALGPAAPSARAAEEDPTADSSFDDAITVTGTGLEVPLGTSGREIEVLTRQEIEDHGIESIPELLQLFPGLDVRRRGVYGVQADLSIRGSSFEQVQVLLDGVPMSNPQTGHHTLDLPVPIDAIERVEVLYGPGSALYGANASGGVVNIITRSGAGARPGSHSGGASGADASVALYAGDHSLGGGAADVSLSTSRAGSHRLSVERIESSGYRPGAEFDQGSAFYRGSIGPIDLSAGASDRDFGANSFYSTRFPDQIESTEARFASAAWSGEAAGTALEVRAAGRWHDDLFVLDRHDPSLLTNHHEDRSLDVQVQGQRETPIGTVQAGTGWIAEDLDSTNLGRRNRDRWGSFAALVGETGRWGWRGALHADRVEGSWEVHPEAALSLRVGRGRLRASAGSAYRLPSFTELYYLDPVSAGNADLEPEHSWTYELGYDRVVAASRVGASVFERRGRDLIDFVRAPGDTLFRAVNLRRVTTRGVELVAARRLGLGGGAPAPTLTASYSSLDSTGDEPEGRSVYVFDYLEHRAVVRLEGTGPAALRWGAVASYNQRHLGDSWVRLDVKASRRLEILPVELFAEVDNLTDERYVERGEVEMPGRWATVGVRLGRR
jgi:iron complex outermembrane receptor protein